MATERFTVVPAVHLLLLRGEEVLFLRRYNTGYEDGRWSLPAGHLDGSETVADAVVREAREEIGIDLEPTELEFAHVMHRRIDGGPERVDFFFAARTWLGEPQVMEPAKCDGLSWHALDSYPIDVIPYVAAALVGYGSRTRYSEFGWELSRV
jgi:8-oxo-dGTP pyrophosphatase MutT (NUDIX family)